MSRWAELCPFWYLAVIVDSRGIYTVLLWWKIICDTFCSSMRHTGVNEKRRFSLWRRSEKKNSSWKAWFRQCWEAKKTETKYQHPSTLQCDAIIALPLGTKEWFGPLFLLNKIGEERQKKTEEENTGIRRNGEEWLPTHRCSLMFWHDGRVVTGRSLVLRHTKHLWHTDQQNWISF